MAKRTYRATSRVEGLRKKGDLIFAGEKFEIEDEQTKELLAPRGPLESLSEDAAQRTADAGKK